MMGFNMQEELASPWLAKEDAPGPGMNLTIARVTCEEVGQDREKKFALHWQQRGVKPMLVNKTNIRVLVALFGPDSDGWLARTVNVYNDPTIGFGGATTGGLRIRVPAPTRPGTPIGDALGAMAGPGYQQTYQQPAWGDRPAQQQPQPFQPTGVPVSVSFQPHPQGPAPDQLAMFQQGPGHDGRPGAYQPAPGRPPGAPHPADDDIPF